MKPDCITCYFESGGKCDHAALIDGYILDDSIPSPYEMMTNGYIHPANYGVPIDEIEECGFHSIGNPYEAKDSGVCNWRTAGEEGCVYSTDCGQTFEFSNDEGIDGNGFKFCYNCGKKIVSKI